MLTPNLPCVLTVYILHEKFVHVYPATFYLSLSEVKYNTHLSDCSSLIASSSKCGINEARIIANFTPCQPIPQCYTCQVSHKILVVDNQSLIRGVHWLYGGAIRP